MFHVTTKISSSCFHLLNSSSFIPQILKSKIEDCANLKIQVLLLEELKQISFLLRSIPTSYEEYDKVSKCKWLHELMEGTFLILQKKTKEEKLVSPERLKVIEILKKKEEERKYLSWTQNIITQEDRNLMNIGKDIKIINQQISLGMEIVIMTFVMFVAGYFIADRTYNNFTTSMLVGVLFGISGLMIESWLFIIRSQRNEQMEITKVKKKDRYDLSGLRNNN